MANAKGKHAIKMTNVSKAKHVQKANVYKHARNRNVNSDINVCMANAPRLAENARIPVIVGWDRNVRKGFVQIDAKK